MGALKLGGKPKCMEVQVGGKKCSIPLADHMSMQDAKAMLRIERMPKSEQDAARQDFYIAYFERYIGEEAFSSLTMADFGKLVEAWNADGDAQEMASPGE